MSVLEILKKIKSGEMEFDLRGNFVDKETIFKYNKIKSLLEDANLLNGFMNNDFKILYMYYFRNMTIFQITNELGYSDERSIYRHKASGIKTLEEKFSKE